MNEIGFRNWLSQCGVSKKLQSDYVSRIKRIEREFDHCDVDEHYRCDKCKYLMSLFLKNGKNTEMEKYKNIQLPVGKYYMSTYRHAVKKYVEFSDGTL